MNNMPTLDQLNLALTCALLNQTLYDTEEGNGPFLHIFREERNFGINMGVLTTPSHTFWVFRGSVTLEDWLSDGISYLPCNVDGTVYPLGFAEGVLNFMDKIEKMSDIPKPDVITGHSLGAAHAMIYYCSAFRVRENPESLVTLGCPNLIVENDIPNIQKGSPVQNFRNGQDYVTTVPPWPWGPYWPETELSGGHDATPSFFMYHHIKYYVAGLQKLIAQTKGGPL